MKIDKKLLLSYDLQFFGKDGPGGEKTEDATPKKLSEARKDGKVAKSQDVIIAASLTGLFVMLKITIGYIGSSFLSLFEESYGMIYNMVNDEFTLNSSATIIRFGMQEVMVIGIPLYLTGLITVLVANIYQVKWKVSFKIIQPKLSNINPISGFKKLLSKEKIFELLKSILKVGIIGYVVYDALKEKWGLLFNMYELSLWDAISLIGDTVISLGLKICMFFIVIAVADFYYQKHRFKEDMKMTKQEVKDEYKNSEGDPQIKGQIRQKMREASQRRMMQSMPEADVVITNPTHLAVAIKYDRDSQSAPVVIAKGAGFLASKIKEAANENHVEIVENKPLARMLYYNVDIDAEIPPELYQMVAEVLAYVYNLKGKL